LWDNNYTGVLLLLTFDSENAFDHPQNVHLGAVLKYRAQLMDVARTSKTEAAHAELTGQKVYMYYLKTRCIFCIWRGMYFYYYGRI